MKKKVISLLLTASVVATMIGCGSSDNGAAAETPAADAAGTEAVAEEKTEEAADEAGAYELTEIKMVVDGTLTATEDSGQDAFKEQWEQAVGEKIGHDITLNIQQLDHSGYNDAVGRLFAGGDYPDVMIMSASMYAQYATSGMLWDMTDAFDNASFHSRITAPQVNENLKKDGRLYGFAPAYGNGCVTYVKQSWLDSVGISADSIKTFDDYYNMLLAFHDGDPDGNGVDGDTYGTIAAGYAKTDEAPYIMYLPEFWQDAYPAIYKNADGQWVDGFQEQATKDALLRLQKARQDGAIDPETLTASTKIAREKYFSNEQSGSAGAFAYWAGTWYQTLTDNLIKNEVDTDLVELAPIAEVGAYINREAPVWVIIDDGDGDNSREQAIFDAFCDTMLDGGRVQVLWTYGAEGVHWSTEAEDFVTNADDPEKKKEYSYPAGEFHLKQTPNDENTVWKKNAMDPALVIAPLEGEYANYTATSELAVEGNKFFTSHMKDAYSSPSSLTYTDNAGSITDAQNVAIAEVVENGGDVDAAVQTYIDTVGGIVEQILSELNAAE